MAWPSRDACGSLELRDVSLGSLERDYFPSLDHSKEAEEGRRTYFQFKNCKSPPDPKPTDTESAMEYLDRLVMPLLLPAIEATLQQAIKWNCLELQKCRFNGVDNIVEILWNQNPVYSERAQDWTTLFKIPMVKRCLQENPRPIFPKSWIWTENEAAVVIQAAVRSFLLRCHDEVQEMRQFWKAMRQISAEERLRCQEEEEEEKIVQQEKEEQEMRHREHKEVTMPITEKLLDSVVETVQIAENKAANIRAMDPD